MMTVTLLALDFNRSSDGIQRSVVDLLDCNHPVYDRPVSLLPIGVLEPIQPEQEAVFDEPLQSAVHLRAVGLCD